MTHASVFSGIGGPEVAATMLGWENLFHCEINPFGRQVLDYWYPNSKSYEDITTTDFTEWRGRVDVLTGGFPCQPFSLTGDAEARRMTATSGRQCIAPSTKSSPLGFFAERSGRAERWLRTLLESSRLSVPDKREAA